MFSWWSCFSFHWSCLHVSKLKSTKLLPSRPTHFMYFAIKMAQLPVLLRKNKFPVLSSRDLLYYISLTSLCFPESFLSAQRIILHLYKMINGFHIPAAHTSFILCPFLKNKFSNFCTSAHMSVESTPIMFKFYHATKPSLVRGNRTAFGRCDVLSSLLKSSAMLDPWVHHVFCTALVGILDSVLLLLLPCALSLIFPAHKIWIPRSSFLTRHFSNNDHFRWGFIWSCSWSTMRYNFLFFSNLCSNFKFAQSPS